MNEVGLNAKWLGADLTHTETQEFTKKVLVHMRDRLSDYQEKYGDLYNLEATPAESTTYRLAKHDLKRYPDIVTAAEDGGTPYYTNSSHLPVGFSSDIFDALDIQDELQTLYTSGTVFHAFLGEKLPDWKSAAALVRKIAENYKLPYYTLSPTYSVCRDHGYLNGEQFTCPICGNDCEVYSRITGYYRPVRNWNDGKAQEYKDRKLYDIENSVMKKAVSRKTESTEDNVGEACSSNCCEPKTEGIMLFTTKTCPNCRIAVSMLEKAGIGFEKLDAEENAAQSEAFGIRQAPTLIVTDGERFEKYAGASEIKKFTEKFGA